MITALEEFKAYNLAMEIAEDVWTIVIKWGYFEKDTVGKQLVRAVDSIAANLSEGLGRYHYREAKNFSYYSRGSLFETKTWITKSFNRDLVSQEQYEDITERLEVLGKMVNGYINSIGNIHEPFSSYDQGLNNPDNEHNLATSPIPNAQYPMPNP